MAVPQCWLHRFACLVAVATFLLLVAGATVTSHRAGLAVPDWPTTYGHNLFLFPLSKMDGGIFYEHGHRLIASTVGLLTIVLALWLVRAEPRRWVRRLGITALAAVIAQGLLGGLTVKFFLPPPVSIFHASLAQAFFCLTIALALATSPRWFGPAAPLPRARLLQGLALFTTCAVFAQLILGATIRHAEQAVVAHIIGAIIVSVGAVATGLAFFSGVRRRDFILPSVALALLVFAQFILGVLAYVVHIPKDAIGHQPSTAQVVLPTLHLAVGALILAASFTLTVKSFRHLRPADAVRPLPWPAWLELTKPRIAAMVLVTTTLGFFLGRGDLQPVPTLLLTLLGVGLATAGAAVLNNYLERDVDAKMARTRGRALPAGIIEPSGALGLGVTLLLLGLFVLLSAVNLLTAFLVLLAAFLYVLVYTPMKRLTWLNTTFGAIPGAIPPLAGWAASTGRLDAGAWVLFGILFAWQHPHFFAIAWMFRDDYAQAGLRMLPVVEPDGASTFRQTLLFSVFLLIISALPALMGMAGRVYLAGALALGVGLLVVGLLFTRRQGIDDARRLLKASVLYLPLLLILILVDAGL